MKTILSLFLALNILAAPLVANAKISVTSGNKSYAISHIKTYVANSRGTNLHLNSFKGNKKAFDKAVYPAYKAALRNTISYINSRVSWNSNLTQVEIDVIVAAHIIVVQRFYPFANRHEVVVISQWGRTNKHRSLVKRAQRHVKERYYHF